MMCDYGSYYGGLGGYASAGRWPDVCICTDGWAEWSHAAAMGWWA